MRLLGESFVHLIRRNCDALKDVMNLSCLRDVLRYIVVRTDATESVYADVAGAHVVYVNFGEDMRRLRVMFFAVQQQPKGQNPAISATLLQPVYLLPHRTALSLIR